MAMVYKEYLLKAFGAFSDAERAPIGWISAMKTAEEIVEEAPGVEIGRVGMWKLTEAYPHKVYCSVCYATYVPNSELEPWRADEDGHWRLPRNFCPNCGAYMEREVN